MRPPTPRLTRALLLCAAGLSCAPHDETATATDDGPPSSITHALLGTAKRDATLRVPVCNIPSPSCDSSTLLTGRGAMGPETNAPNTLADSCADGDDGTFHSAASVDALRVATLDGTALTAGKTVTVSADVWGAPGGGSALMLFQAKNVQAPQWSLLATLTPTGGALETLSTTFVLPEDGLQAVRAALVDASQANGTPCVPGAQHDHDDLVFAVAPSGPAAPMVALSSPSDGATLTGIITITADAYDANGIYKVDFLVDGVAKMSDFSPPYEFPVNTRYTYANGSHTLTAQARDNQGNTTLSAPVVITVDNDTTSPTVISVLPGISRTVSNLVTLGADVSDDRGISRVEFEIDNVVVGTDTSAPYSVEWNSRSVANGEHQYTVRPYDTSGNTVAWGTNMYVRNDYAAPAVSITHPAEGATVAGYSGVFATASDDIGVTRVEFYLDGTVLLGTSTIPQYGASWNTQAFSAGAHALTARAYDAAGNVTTSAPVNVIVDPPPTAAVTSPAAGAVLTGTVSLTATVSDNTGVTRVDFRAGTAIACNAYSPTYSCTWNTRQQPNGSIQVRAEAYDAAGNQTISAPVTYTLDNDFTAPAVSLTSPAAGTTLTGMVTVSADAVDNKGVTLVEFFAGTTLIGTDRTEPYSITWNSANLPNGTYALKARAWDAAYNLKDSATRTISVFNENVPPTVAFTSPTEGATLSGLATLTASASDDQSGINRVEFYLGYTLLATDTAAPYTYSLDTRNQANGAYVLTAKAYDGVGNMGSTTVNVTVNNDTTAPTVSLTSPAQNAVLRIGTTYTLSASASDNVGVSQVQFFLDGMLLGTDTAAPYSMSWYNNTTAGYHYLLARAYDAAGNMASSTAVNVTVEYPPVNSGTLTYSASNTSSATVGTSNRLIALSPGHVLTLGTCGVAGASYSGDTYLRLYGPSGTQVIYNDDACGGYGSSFTYTVPAGAGGNYELRAGCYSSGSCSGTVAWTIQ